MWGRIAAPVCLRVIPMRIDSPEAAMGTVTRHASEGEKCSALNRGIF